MATIQINAFRQMNEQGLLSIKNTDMNFPEKCTIIWTKSKNEAPPLHPTSLERKLIIQKHMKEEVGAFS